MLREYTQNKGIGKGICSNHVVQGYPFTLGETSSICVIFRGAPSLDHLFPGAPNGTLSLTLMEVVVSYNYDGFVKSLISALASSLPRLMGTGGAESEV